MISIAVSSGSPRSGAATSGAPEWRVGDGLTEYPVALAEMQARVAAIRAGTAGELVWLVEHPPLYTAGTSAKPGELTDPGAVSDVQRPGAAGNGPITVRGSGPRT